MLVLTRKLGENIRIGNDVKITILEVRSGQVKIGVEAPPEVSVHREEVWLRIREESGHSTSDDRPDQGSLQDRPPPSSRTAPPSKPPGWFRGIVNGGSSA